jgi:hypothetical protein
VGDFGSPTQHRRRTNNYKQRRKAMSKKQEVKMTFTIPEGWDMHEFVQVLMGAYTDIEGSQVADMVQYRYRATA